jgi:ribonuclease Z
MSFELTILGNSSATPTLTRHPSAQYLNLLDHHILIDCGEGTQVQLKRYKIKKARLEYIFISHVHADHILGLPGLIFSMNLGQRTTPLTIFAPESLFEILDLFLKHSDTHLRFDIIRHYTNHTKTEVILENALIKVTSFPLFHRVPTTGFLFEEQARLKKINAKACEKLHVPFTYFNDLKRGKDYVSADGKTVIENHKLTFETGEPLSYAYASDTIFDERVAESVQHVDVLYHECTFAHDKLERAIETMHTTALQAGTIAKQAAVKKLIIGHFSTRYDDLNVLLNEAKTVFENTEIAEEGRTFIIE